MIKTIKERLESGYYQEHPFGEEEVFYIERSAELLTDLVLSFVQTDIDKLGNYYDVLYNLSYNNGIMEYIFENDSLSNFENEFYFRFGLIAIHKDGFFDVVNSLVLMELIDEDYAPIMNKRINNYLFEHQKDLKYNYTVNSHEQVEYIVDNKLFFLLNSFDDMNDYFLSKNKNEQEYLKNIIAENNLPIPDFLKLYCGLPVESLSDNDLIKEIRNRFSEYPEEVIEREIIKRINNKKILETDIKDAWQFSNSNMGLFPEIIVKDLNKNEIIGLIRNGFINENMIRCSLDNHIFEDDEFCEILISLLDENNSESFFDNLYSGVRKERFVNNFFEKIIEKGYGLYLLDLSNKLSPDSINKIYEQIKNGNNKVNEVSRFKINNAYPMDFIKWVLTNVKMYCVYIPSAELLNSEIIDCLNNNIRNINGLKEIITPYIDEKILDALLEKGLYNNVIFYITEHKNMSLDWLEKHNDNPFLFYKLMNQGICDQELYHPIIGNELITPEILDFFIHNDEIFTEESYEKIRDYLKQKYNININNLDLLEKRFGTMIINYFLEGDIDKLINLDEEKLKKIVALFPKVNYTLTDVEASYESINQYLFSKKVENRQIINIFSNIMHAYEEKDLERLNNYKSKILTILDCDVFEKIREKYGINDKLSMEECLDFIFNNLDNEQILDILHSITNGTIESERKYYRNNHYYISKNVNDFNNDIYNFYFDIHSNLYLKKYQSYIFDELKIKYNVANLNELLDLFSETVDELKINSILEIFNRNIINNDRANSPIGYTIFDELGINYNFDNKKIDNMVKKEYLKNLYIDDVIKIKKELEEIGISSNETNEIINAIKTDSNFTDDVKRNIGIFLKTAKKYIDLNPFYEMQRTEVISDLDNMNKLQRNFYCSNNNNLFPVLAGLNVKLIESNLLDNEELYSMLLDIMSTKKPHLMDPKIFEFLNSNGFDYDLNTISDFINFFPSIVQKNKDKLGDNKSIKSFFSPIEILKQGNCYSSFSSLYSSILGKEDASLIKLNPGPNAAPTSDYRSRLNNAISDEIKCYKRQDVCIPPLDENLVLDNNKVLRVVAGNFTSPCNLTHGERTGACMRIDGAGEELYRFCIDDNRGFHIRFENPKDNTYVSRVSGFRNGNTVFLNQLRFSKDKNYSNKDLIEATKKIANYFIEESKKSTSKIENVFVTDCYALSYDTELPKYKINSSEVTSGIKEIYTDYSYNYARLLATTAETDYVPINTKQKNELYKVQRSKPKITINDESNSISQINRVHSMKQLLNGKTIQNDDIETINEQKNIIYCVSNDDWYISVDKDLEIKSDYIDNDERAKEELDKYMLIVKEAIDKKIIKEKSNGHI